ncbi:alpha/beta hydrolase [Paenibacillus sp. NEAU-GSW1]|uniref:alpha/beta hydrolase n=1 Tax=Paenibacillus sp. NEAU-GSW1 TaxID=2682486 RepID=UPI0012E24FDA|nr:alpha/beta hydrolase [Paenibacillus sp. NEAU-GSW1]MUT68826.1 alpha/beta hydrolase fold domain-containing protein [Paenibacillus sp. NEAU-GSW1]
MFYQIIGITILGLAVLPAAGCAAIIPWRFEIGKSWYPAPLKMIYPAAVWPLTVVSFMAAIGGIVLALAATEFTVIWYMSLFLTLIALGAGIAHASYIRRVTRPHTGFAETFGADWKHKLPADNRMLSQRWLPFRYSHGRVIRKREAAIWAFKESERERYLLADIWQPAEDTKPTGVAFLFFHGSAWHFFDKGAGTDPMFRHLAAQGHVIIDVAYRLAPEVDLIGMTTDVKRAVIWAKENAVRLGIDPAKIVVGGASAGGHISLLAAYGHDHPDFTPDELKGRDASVAGVISLYGLSDLRAYLSHHGGRATITGKPAEEAAPVLFNALNAEQMMMNLCGGMPDSAAPMFDLADVKNHVNREAPPTLIFQGEFDFITPKAATIQLVERLRDYSVPVIYVEMHKTEHAWDVITSMANEAFPRLRIPAFLDSQYAPPTRAALYDIERFLACLA